MSLVDAVQYDTLGSFLTCPVSAAFGRTFIYAFQNYYKSKTECDLCRDNAVVEFRFGLGTKTTLLAFWRDHGLG